MNHGTRNTSASGTDTDASQLQPNRRDLLMTGAGALTGTVVSAIAAAPAAAQTVSPEPLTADRKMPSAATIKLRNDLRGSLPFADKKDLEEAQRGFLGKPDRTQIMTDDGKKLVWDISRYLFLLKGKDFNTLKNEEFDQLLKDQAFDSINPSLQRIAILNMGYGLYEVVKDAIYQVRGFDLTNMTFVKSTTGWIVIDPLTASETAAAALAFINKQLGERPVKAVIYSHAHGDHFGGVRGIVDEKKVGNGKDQIRIIAPEHFMEYAVAENVMAGNAMSRRLAYQYGTILPAGPFAHVDQSIGKALATGTAGLIAPTDYIKAAYETRTIDGVEMQFQNTPDTESPAEMNTYFPQWDAFWAAENITATIHNIYTLRGAMVRDSLAWSKNINEALWRYGHKAKVMFASHSWPRFGNARVQEVMRGQRDAYAHLNNYVLFLANQGTTINEVHNVYEPPKSLREQWYARSYHGSTFHNSRAVINRYIGYWDCNPATLVPLSPEDSAPLYVQMMGGAKKIIEKGRQLHEEGKYLLGAEILNKLIYAEPKNQEAKYLLADMYEQLGYQYESNSLRNSFLAAARELRNGLQAASGKSASPDVVRAMPTGLFLDFLGVRLDSAQAEKENMAFTILFKLPDVDEEHLMEMSNATLTNIDLKKLKDVKDLPSPSPNLTITMDRPVLEALMAAPPGADISTIALPGPIKFDGDQTVLAKLKSALVTFTPDFELLPGTASAQKPPAIGQANLFAEPEPELFGE
jgi:alkyl sulfatase BDS1-like metallo-beta-lactamase superfamily hydrolase